MSLASLMSWLQTYQWQLAYSLAAIAIYLIVSFLMRPRIVESAENSGLKPNKVDEVTTWLALSSRFIVLLLLFLIWGADLKNIGVFITSMFTVIGVALFASWSILSNITSFFILLSQPSFKRGNFIRVLFGDYYIEGYVSEISLFQTRIITEDRELVVFPNNQLISTPTIVNSRVRFNGVGKSIEMTNAADAKKAKKNRALPKRLAK